MANTSILGYNLDDVYEGRGPLEAASIGYEMQPDDLALRCNLLSVADGLLLNHHGGHLSTEEGDVLIKYLDRSLGSDRIKFLTGTQYRHLLVIKGGNKHLDCAPPHDHPANRGARCLCALSPTRRRTLGRTTVAGRNRQSAQRSDNPLSEASCRPPPKRITLGKGQQHMALGRRLPPRHADSRRNVSRYGERRRNLRRRPYPGHRKIRGSAPHRRSGITGLADTNYEGKAAAAIEALRNGFDFVFLHVEASDEAGHDGDLDLKLKTISNLDQRVVRPIFDEVSSWTDTPVSIAVLPDHPTPVEIRTHVADPVPFCIWHPGIEPDDVESYDEFSAMRGAYGLLSPTSFMHLFSTLPNPYPPTN